MWRLQLQVLERSGNAPITLVGQIQFEHSHEAKHTIPFIAHILKHKWARIKYLSIRTNAPEIIAQIHRSIQRPAPFLEYFLYWISVSDESQSSGPLLDDGKFLFLNCSPRLAFFCVDGFTFNFSPSNPISQIRRLWLSGFIASFTIPDLHRSLQQLPMLEELFIDYLMLRWRKSSQVSVPTNSDINLPELKEITVRISHRSGSSESVTNLVRYIIPAHGCHLVVENETFDELNDAYLSILGQVYARFITKFANFGPAHFLRLKMMQNIYNAFRLRLANHEHDNLYLPETYPSISLSYDDGNQTQSHGGRANVILEQFSIPIISALTHGQDLGHISQLDLCLDDTTAFIPEVLALLRKLTSLVTLEANPSTLRALTDIQTICGFVLFPCLTTLVLTGSTSRKDHLRAFLEARVERGLPVHFLTLGPKVDSCDDERWNFLDKFEDLFISWKEREYAPGISLIIDAEPKE